MTSRFVPKGAEFLRMARESERKAAIPPELDRIVDTVLAYTPKPKTKAQKKRARKAKK